MKVFDPKDPADRDFYEYSFADLLPGDDAILTFSIAADEGITTSEVALDGVKVGWWAEGGEHAKIYGIDVTVGTTEGRTLQRKCWVPVLEK